MTADQLYAMGEQFYHETGEKVDVFYSDIHNAFVITKYKDIDTVYYMGRV